MHLISKKYCMSIGLIVGLAGCGVSTPTPTSTITSTITSTPTADTTCSNYASTSMPTVIAEDIVLMSATPFDRYIKYNGLTLFAMPTNTDNFLINVAKTYRDMLGGDLGNTSSCVDTLKTIFTDNKIAQRLWKTDSPAHHEGDSGFDSAGYEAQDLIQEGVDSEQANAVIEHLLHTITVLGLSRVFPNKWDYTDTNSDLYLSMQQAIDGGFYDTKDHDHLKASNLADYQLISQQEFAYMAILTAWGLKAQVWPDSTGEWTLTTTSDIRDNLPLFWTLYENTIEGFLVAPAYSDLQARFPL